MWIKISLILAWFVTYLTAVAAFYAFSHLIVTLKQMNLRNRTILSKYLNDLIQTHDFFIKKIKEDKNIPEKELNTYLSLLLITDHKVPKKLNIVKSIDKKVLIHELRNINDTHEKIMISSNEELISWLERILKRKIKIKKSELKSIIVTLGIFVFFPEKELITHDKDVHPLIKEIFLDQEEKGVDN